MQTSKRAKATSERILAFISFGVIVYSIVQLFSDTQTAGPYIGAILLASIMFILSLANIAIQESNSLNSQTIKIEKETMIYKEEEMIEEAELAKSLEEHLDKVISNPLNKLVILRGDKPDAVMLPIEEYERMKNIANYLEEIKAKKFKCE